MEYNKIVETIQAGHLVEAKEATGVQIFMLLHDNIIKTIKSQTGGEYELHFILLDEPPLTYIAINSRTCPRVSDARSILGALVYRFHTDPDPLYIMLEDEPFKIEIEVLISGERE